MLFHDRCCQKFVFEGETKHEGYVLTQLHDSRDIFHFPKLNVVWQLARQLVYKSYYVKIPSSALFLASESSTLNSKLSKYYCQLRFMFLIMI